MRVLVACEESQEVCKAFRAKGHEAYSCDTQYCSGGHPEYHIKNDIMRIVKGGHITLQNGDKIYIDKWDIMIAFPPCTRLTVAANKYYKPEYALRFPNIHQERKVAIDFFIGLVNTEIEKKAIENPIGIMSTRYRKPDQIIQPYYFGDPERKATCLWLNNLPKLTETNLVEPIIIKHKSGKTDGKLHYETLKLTKEERSRIRSKTFPGIAKAMADQWG